MDFFIIGRSARFALLLIAGFAIAGCELESDVDESGALPDDNIGTPGGGTPDPAALAAVAPAAISQEATGALTVVSLGDPRVSGGDGNYTMENDAPANGFPLGATLVTWSVTDGAGERVSVTQAVTISDTTAPQFGAVSNVQTVTTGTLTPVSLTAPTVTDIVDPSPTMSNNEPANGYPLGMTTVTWTAIDASGNQSQVSQTVMITEAAAGPLTITAPGNVSAEATAPATQISLGNATASGGQGMVNITNDAPAGGFPVGTTTVGWTATDGAGTTVSDNQRVTIRDTTPPSINAPDNITVDSTGSTTTVALGSPTVSDIADSAPTVVNNAPAGGFPLGITVVAWTATDASGNEASDVQRVTVNAAPPPVTCQSLQPEFASTIYPILDKPERCQSCHTPPNAISSANGFNLQANDEAAFEVFRAIANIEIGGQSSILVKSLGGVAHGGGNRFSANGSSDPDYIELESFVSELARCEETPPTSTATIEKGSGYEQLYKVTMSLGSRPPSDDEIAAIEARTTEAGIQAALDTTIEQLMSEDAFYTRMLELYNDVLLTDRDADNRREVEQLFDVDAFSRKDFFENRSNQNDRREDTNYGFAKAPLELIRYVLENDRPFTEVLTADYMMVNPYSATILGVDAGDPNFPFSSDEVTGNHDRNDFRRVDSVMQDDRAGLPLPLAGVVATHAWLARYPSTNTNANRHRTASVFKQFLGIDIEAIAPRDGLDLDNVIGSVPTYEDPQCTVCHNVMDPVAGLFKNRENQGEYRGDVRWHHTRTTNGVPRMLPPGYTMDAADALPAGEFDRGLSWLMDRLVADERFAKQTVRTVFEGFTRIDSTSAATTSFLTGLQSDFIASNYDMKSLVKAVALSDYFLARNLAPGENPSAYLDYGTARMLTPEELDRRISALIGDGYQWEGPNSRSGLVEDYRLLYGGINSNDVTEREVAPNSLLDATQTRIGLQIACERVALELNGGDGNLFPAVGIADTPPSAENAIRDNLVHLHRWLLGEDLAADDPEIDSSYQLFLDVRNAGENDITNACRGGGGATDNNGTIIPWIAVVSYLMSDYRFFYE
ncbi:MAG: HYR domain-containing protein [Pseudomonadota bacterium]